MPSRGTSESTTRGKPAVARKSSTEPFGGRPRAERRSAIGDGPTRVVVENVCHPGKSRSVDADRYGAMRSALMKVLPRRNPGATLADVSAAVLAHLPNDLFPGGAAAGWWLKTVQLDLEAKGMIAREATRPLRLHRA
jgi:hypothetical protein